MTADLMLLRRRLMDRVRPIDYSPYFNYTISNGCAYVTSVKRDAWLSDFGNLNIIVPASIQGCPVKIIS